MKNNTNKNRIYYSFLTFVLFICIIQIGVSAFNNIAKTVSYDSKIKTMKKLNRQVISQNEKLKNSLENFGSLQSLEAIARNNLKMAGEGEVLVIINKKSEEFAPLKTSENSKTAGYRKNPQ